ncbi:MAG: thermonuclease family protein [Candidatus Omnitrophica bacterium]|nr:thermonuclease family protein [Candidatus Omnitrophota bacterium]
MIRIGRALKRYPVWIVGPALAALLLTRVLESGQADSGLQSAEAVVERVIDGDTVVLAGGARVRYIGVDTPELHHPRKPVEFYAREAKEFNRRLVGGKKVRLEWDVQRRDRYQRQLAYLFLEDGTFVNAELLRQGCAQLLTIPPNVKYADLFVKMQKEAREAKRGLWGKR